MSGSAAGSPPPAAAGLWRLALPTMGELVVISLGNFAEVLFLGRIGDDAVAAYGAVAPVLIFGIVFLRLSAQGAGAVLSRYHGAGDGERLRQAQFVTMGVSLCLGVLLAGALALLRGPIFALMGLTGAAAGYAEQYALGWSLVLLIMSVRFPLSAFAAAFGNTRWALAANLAGTGVAITANTVLSPWIVGLSHPALAVALVVASGYVVNLAVLVRLARGTDTLRMHRPARGTLREISADLVRVVLPGTLDPVQFNLFIICLTTLVASFGSEHLSARAYGTQIGSFIFMYSMALAQAGQVLAARALGAGDAALVRRRLRAARLRGAAGASIVSLAVVAVAAGQLDLLAHSPTVVSLTLQLLLIGLVLEPARSLNITTNLALTAVGDGRFVLLTGAAFSWLLGLPLSYLLGHSLGLGVVGVWTAMAFDEAVRAVVGTLRWRRIDLTALVERARRPERPDRPEGPEGGSRALEASRTCPTESEA